MLITFFGRILLAYREIVRTIRKAISAVEISDIGFCSEIEIKIIIAVKSPAMSASHTVTLSISINALNAITTKTKLNTKLKRYGIIFVKCIPCQM